MIRILIIDDHPIVLEGSKILFDDVTQIDVDTENDVQNVKKRILKKSYDIYLVDINMPKQNGIEVADDIQRIQPSAKIIFYTGDNIEDYYFLLAQKKYYGLLSKTSTKETIIQTIMNAMNGNILLPHSFLSYVHEQIEPTHIEQTLQLNKREEKILNYVIQGYTNNAIAAELNLTQRTIERNLSKIYHLLNVNSRTEAALKAKELHLV
ncbi:response regulator transcription factor [Rummeliibacillus suwonensis]|uniref:response regulator transcription factor n=1 Tax=Rummeliibacillus suwonensis TaxID=1306154 RepID=UPI00289BC104|nr:response regulator transcription factor [Rummeliibacillus suwonensis]